MKKSTSKKLSLRHETIKSLQGASLALIAGGEPARTRDLPCIERTHLDCESLIPACQTTTCTQALC